MAFTHSDLFSVDTEPPAPDRGRRAWDLLRREWGKTVADTLWRRQPVRFRARNRCLYEIQPYAAYFEVRNLTMYTAICVDVEGGSAYPLADRLLAVLEHLRLHPDTVERVGAPRPLNQWFMRTWVTLARRLGAL